jgi:hypothetical protein
MLEIHFFIHKSQVLYIYPFMLSHPEQIEVAQLWGIAVAVIAVTHA